MSKIASSSDESSAQLFSRGSWLSVVDKVNCDNLLFSVSMRVGLSVRLYSSARCVLREWLRCE